MGTICIDCNLKMASRRKSSKRCFSCWSKLKKKNAHGRIIGIFCKKCGKELSCKKNTTLLCINCWKKSKPQPPNKGEKGKVIAWNKGKSIFKTKEDYRIHKNLIRKKRRLLNHKEKIADRLRTLIRNQIKKYSGKGKGAKTIKLLGCDIGFFIIYLENKFTVGMSWDNYGNGHGKWNIDHIIPVSRFNLNKTSEQKKRK